MSFGDFKSVEQVIALYPLQMKRVPFLPDVTLELPVWFMENLNFSLATQAMQESEMFFRESFIFPFLHQTWKHHPHLKVWVNRSLSYDDRLFGEPDYLVSSWTEEVVDRLINTPLLAVTEAKKQDFESGWGQCLAEMIACQKINADDQLTVYGIVSTGIFWEFGKLEGKAFIRDLLSYSIAEPARVLGILDFIFNECERELPVRLNYSISH